MRFKPEFLLGRVPIVDGLVGSGTAPGMIPHTNQ